MADVGATYYSRHMSDISDTMARQVSDTAARHSMFPADSPVVLMLSGGGDSVALLRLMAGGSLVRTGLLHALHVDHGLRGDESDGDARFAGELCAEFDIPCRVERVDLAAIASREGLNLEDAGRRERYRLADAYLDRICADSGVDPDLGRIAVAHTRDDRIETFLMRLAQGAGATGLTSLRPTRGRIVRPLIQRTRQEVRDYLHAIGQPWREDGSNAQTDRLRAKVRHELLPLFREINPRFDAALERTLAVLSDEDDLLSEMGEAFGRDFSVSGGDGSAVVLDREMMNTLSRPMKRRALRAALTGAFPETSRMEFEHIEALVDGLSADGFAHDLPGGLRARDEYGRMIVSRVGEESEPLALRLLPVPGILDLGESGRVVAEEAPVSTGDEGRYSVLVDGDMIGPELVVGAPLPGERIRPLGMRGSRKVSDVLADAKVPRHDRARTPVVRDGDKVVWVSGVRQSEEHKVTAGTTRAVRLRWERQ